MTMTTRAQFLFAGLSVVLILGLVFLIRNLSSSSSNDVELVISANVDGEPLEYNDFRYTNPVGTEKFMVRDFRFYISNIEFHGDDGSYRVPDSYHLVRFDKEQGHHAISLADVPLRSFSRIEFSIGIDPVANTSIESKGDLNPNSRMAWNWEVGYKFVLLEGGIKVADEIRPLVYHIGFGENLKKLSFEAPTSQSLKSEPSIDFAVDLFTMFSNQVDVDMADLNTVKFDRNDAALLANNYKDMITVNWPE